MRYSIFPLLLLTPLAFGQSRSPLVHSVAAPVRAEQKAKGHWFFDFGRDAFGNVLITAPNGAAGTNLTVHMGEALSGSNAVNRSPGGSVRYQRHEITLDAGKPASPQLTWTPPDWMKSGWLTPPEGMGQVMPFRYVEIEGAPDSFSDDHIRRISWNVPFKDDASSFTSSSIELDAVWSLCKYSIKATSFLGLYVDGDRERKPYEADALINQLSHYCVDERYDTARLTHEYLLMHPTWPTEWQLQSVMLGWLDFLWSGDDTSLRRHYATLKNRAMVDRRTPDGLFRGNESDIVDWPAGERDGYDMGVQAKTVVAAWHYNALVLLERIANHLGKTNDAATFTTLARKTFETVNEQLWDESRGCYIDGLDPDTGRISTHASSHANFFPLALGLVPPDRVEQVVEFIKARGMVCSVYGAQFLVEALYEGGEAETALTLLTSDDLRSWRNMSENVGSTITLEAWDPSLKPNLDWNHAWGAAPANLIPRGLMGIEPLEPGFKRFRVRPQTASLRQTSVKVPTPKGPVRLSIHHPSETAWTAELIVPEGSVAELHLPPHRPGTVEASSGPIVPLREEQGRTVVEMRPGTHRLSLELKP